MSEDTSALSKIPPPPAARGDYESICAALVQTERGRWFLAEYARRNRSADTQLLLAAIGRIEAVVCAERNRQAQQGFRSDLLEMAKAITRTRAEVAEIRSETAADSESALPRSEAAPLRWAPPGDVFAAAERIRDVTWAMRGHGFDPSTCDQLEQLAASILSASALRDPTDHRASKLSEVLQYLEHRIETLLESSADGDAPEPEAASVDDGDGFAPTAIKEEMEPGDEVANAANAFVAEAHEPDATAATAAAEEPLSPQNELQGDSLAAHDDFEDPPLAPTLPAAARIQPPEEAAESPPERPILAQDPGLAAQTADPVGAASAEASMEGPADDPATVPPPVLAEPTTAAPAPSGDTAELRADAGLAVEPGAELGAGPRREPSAATPSPDEPPAMPAEVPTPATAPLIDGNGTSRDPLQRTNQGTPPSPLLPIVELPDSGRLMLQAAAAHAASTALREAACALLPQIDLRAERRSFNAAAPPAATEPTPAPTAPALATMRPAQPAPLTQPFSADPLAALKAMSDDELIALFS
jgi:hypothetical protein